MVIEKLEDMESRFPWDIFTPEIYQSFKDISSNSNIPLEFLGVEALFSIASLSGNMYIADINGGIKPILFIAKVGPSGIGKTPSFHKLMGDIISPLRSQYNDEYEQEKKDYAQRERDAKRSKMDFDELPPEKRLRIIEGGTTESIAKHSVTSAAGFAVVYDEGERLFSEVNKYSKGGGDGMGFWNEIFNGKTTEVTRVDADRERFIKSPAISVNIGLQSDRMHKYFTEDAVAGGILNRFLIVESGYIKLNEKVDFFSKNGGACEEWRSIIKFLFEKGLKYKPGTAQSVKVDPEAWGLMNSYGSAMTVRSNQLILNIKEGDASKLISAYRSKLFLYFQRLALTLAIMNNAKHPEITSKEIDGAKKLCIYFEKTAIKMLKKLFDTSTTGLTETEKKLLDLLPEEFSTQEAEVYCESIGVNKKFFSNTFHRKYSKGYVRKLVKGKYEKI